MKHISKPRVFVSSSDEETSASKSDEPVIKLSRVQTSRDHSSGDHRDQNTPEHTEKSPDPVEVEKEVPAAAVNVTIDLEESEVNKEVPAVNVTIDLEGKVPAVNDTIDLVDSDSDKETQGHPEPVYNIEDSGSDTNSYTEVCQANFLPSSSSSSPDSNHSVRNDEEQTALLLNSSEDEVEVESVVTQTQPQPQPPPPPSDAAMSLVRSSLLSAARHGDVDGGDVDDGDVDAPLFVIGRPNSGPPTIRPDSESDEDVRILPSSSRSSKDSKDVIEID